MKMPVTNFTIKVLIALCFLLLCSQAGLTRDQRSACIQHKAKVRRRLLLGWLFGKKKSSQSSTRNTSATKPKRKSASKGNARPVTPYTNVTKRLQQLPRTSSNSLSYSRSPSRRESISNTRSHTDTPSRTETLLRLPSTTQLAQPTFLRENMLSNRMTLSRKPSFRNKPSTLKPNVHSNSQRSRPVPQMTRRPSSPRRRPSHSDTKSSTPPARPRNVWELKKASVRTLSLSGTSDSTETVDDDDTDIHTGYVGDRYFYRKNPEDKKLILVSLGFIDRNETEAFWFDVPNEKNSFTTFKVGELVRFKDKRNEEGFSPVYMISKNDGQGNVELTDNSRQLKRNTQGLIPVIKGYKEQLTPIPTVLPTILTRFTNKVREDLSAWMMQHIHPVFEKTFNKCQQPNKRTKPEMVVTMLSKSEEDETLRDILNIAFPPPQTSTNAIRFKALARVLKESIQNGTLEANVMNPDKIYIAARNDALRQMLLKQAALVEDILRESKMTYKSSNGFPMTLERAVNKGISTAIRNVTKECELLKDP